MLWEVEIKPKSNSLDSCVVPELERVREEYNLLTHSRAGNHLVCGASRGYLLEGPLSFLQAEQLAFKLLVDPIVDDACLGELNTSLGRNGRARRIVTVLPKPGVMDPTAESVLAAGRDLDIPVESVRTFRRYQLCETPWSGENVDLLLYKVLANDTIEQAIVGRLTLEHLSSAADYTFSLVTVPLCARDDAELVTLSKEGLLALNLVEMRAIQDYFRALGRDPTDIELETLAQTWSEHCSHKTLKGQIEFNGRRIGNLLKDTIFAATQEIRKRLGPDDWCVSVFEDNAGVIRFDEHHHVCFKVETHNHPSAIEPYGGANTGIGGVIRDPLGTGLGAQPICNTDVFCFAPPNTSPDDLPPGVLHPRKIMKGVVAGVRDYGNRIGIPTVNGAVCFDSRYLANPLVYCGTVGLIPVDRCHKAPAEGDHIVVIGGRTGRDGIHGATFSSIGLTAASDAISGGAVQIGNAINEKKMLDVILQARDQGLYHAITDCGAGGLSSAVGEMGEKLGACVQLDRVPLKYQGLSYAEIWISESQERMVLAVGPQTWTKLEALCCSEGVEATIIGRFEATGKLRLEYKGECVGELDMHLLHHGRPNLTRKATWHESLDKIVDRPDVRVASKIRTSPANYTEDLLRILASLNVCSKEWIIRQYDHEVQGGSVVKPLVGIRNDGPSDAAVIRPVRTGMSRSWLGLAIGCGINPCLGDFDPYAMAASAIDEAVRNVVAVGADPRHIALLDNFCWGNTGRPEELGSLVRAAEACRDVSLAFGMPFISGKDSLNNEFHAGDRHIAIPPTLLISAIGRLLDVRKCVTMDLKEPNDLLYLIGITADEMGGAHFYGIDNRSVGKPPRVETHRAPRIFHALHEAIQNNLIKACHDLSEGGLAVAAAEMAFAGEVGADLTNMRSPWLPVNDIALLFAESNTRFLVEVAPHNQAAFERCFADGLPVTQVGRTTPEEHLRIAGPNGEWVVWAALADLKEAWQKTLRW